MPQTSRVRGVATRITDGPTVYYHDTAVVTVTPSTITLDTGGWWTVTTKLRMNQAAAEYDLGYHVYQRAGVWYVRYRGETIMYRRRVMTLQRG